MRIFKATSKKIDEENNKPLPDEAAMIPTGLERQDNLALVLRPGAYPIASTNHVASEEDESGVMSIYTSESSEVIPETIQATLVPTGDGAITITVNNCDSEQTDFDEVYEASMVEGEGDGSLPSAESELQKIFKSTTRFQCTLMACLVILAIATVVVTVVGVLRASIGTDNGEIDSISASSMDEESSSSP